MSVILKSFHSSYKTFIRVKNALTHGISVFNFEQFNILSDILVYKSCDSSITSFNAYAHVKSDRILVLYATVL